MSTPGEGEEMRLHEFNQCTGRDFVAERKWIETNKLSSFQSMKTKFSERM